MHGSWFFNENFSGVPDNFFNDVFKFVDFPMEDVEPNGIEEEWVANLEGLEPPPADILSGFTDSFSGQVNDDVKPPINCSGLSDEISQLKQCSATDKALSSGSTLTHENHIGVKDSQLFQTSSPISVLESSGSCSSENNTSVFPAKLFSPVKRPRSKRPRPPTFNPYLWFPFKTYTAGSESDSENPIKRKSQKNKRFSLFSAEVQSLTSQQATRKCTHCETTKTPQWREGPMGPKTLCNACGVRYRSGRLLPEYRPASSPTFIPSFHSNCHRKVIEMRKKAC